MSKKFFFEILKSINFACPFYLYTLFNQLINFSTEKIPIFAGLRSEEAEGSVLVPFPAIKLLYKVFNNQTASNDPRANGEDTSVGLIDLPLPCCEMLIELLLRSSLRSPPACRAVGQFFVGYLQIDDKI